MSSQPVCHFNKFGFCRFGKHCFRYHEDKVCENVGCKVIDCDLRHPRKCRFYQDYHYCKFGSYCKFLHKENEDQAIEAIKNQLKCIMKELKEKEKEIKILCEKNEIIEKDVEFLKNENEILKERLNVN